MRREAALHITGMSEFTSPAEQVETYGLPLFNWSDRSLVCAGQICAAQVRRADLHVVLLQARTTEET